MYVWCKYTSIFSDKNMFIICIRHTAVFKLLPPFVHTCTYCRTRPPGCILPRSKPLGKPLGVLSGRMCPGRPRSLALRAGSVPFPPRSRGRIGTCYTTGTLCPFCQLIFPWKHRNQRGVLLTCLVPGDPWECGMVVFNNGLDIMIIFVVHWCNFTKSVFEV